MILITGASGRLGGLVARQLLAAGRPVRAMSRTPSALNEIRQLGAEVIQGDLRDRESLVAACQGTEAIITATHAFNGNGANGSATVDGTGNRNLVEAARAANVRHIVFTSIFGARADHPVPMYRYKYATEQYLRQSGLDYTIVRPTAFMELWMQILGETITKQGKAMVFGRGVNPVNFVSVKDVAALAVLALDDERAHNAVIDIGGPENVSQMQFVTLIEQASGRQARIQHIPLPMMRVMRTVALPFNPGFSTQVLAGIIMDTQDMTFDPGETLARFPLRLTRLSDVISNQFDSAKFIGS